MLPYLPQAVHASTRHFSLEGLFGLYNVALAKIQEVLPLPNEASSLLALMPQLEEWTKGHTQQVGVITVCW